MLVAKGRTVLLRHQIFFTQVFGMPSIHKAVTDFRKIGEEAFGVKDVKALGATGAISPTK